MMFPASRINECLILVPRLYQIHNVPQRMSPQRNILRSSQFLDSDVAVGKSAELPPKPAILHAWRLKRDYRSALFPKYCLWAEVTGGPRRIVGRGIRWMLAPGQGTYARRNSEFA